MRTTTKIVLKTHGGAYSVVNITLCSALKQGYKISFYYDRFAIVTKSNKLVAVKV